MISKTLKPVAVSLLCLGTLVSAETLHKVTYDNKIVKVYKSADLETAITEFSAKDTLVIVPFDDNHAFKSINFKFTGEDASYFPEVISSDEMDYARVFTNVTEDFTITAAIDTAFTVQDTVYSADKDSLCFVNIFRKRTVPGDTVSLIVNCGIGRKFKQLSCIDGDGEKIELTEPVLSEDPGHAESKFKMPLSDVYCSASGERQYFKIKYVASAGKGKVSTKQDSALVDDIVEFKLVPDDHYRLTSYPKVCIPRESEKEDCFFIDKDENGVFNFSMYGYDVTVRYGFEKWYDVSVADYKSKEEYEKGRCSLSESKQEPLEMDTVTLKGRTQSGMAFDSLRCVDEKKKAVNFFKRDVEIVTKKNTYEYEFSFQMPASKVSCECFASKMKASLTYTNDSHIKFFDVPESVRYKDTVKFQVKVDEGYALDKVRYSPDPNTTVNIACSENEEKKNTFDCSFVLEYLGEIRISYKIKEKIKDAIVPVEKASVFNVMVSKKTLSISGIKVGFRIAVLDMQGKTIACENAASTVANVQVPRAGRYMVKVLDHVEVVTVK